MTMDELQDAVSRLGGDLATAMSDAVEAARTANAHGMRLAIRVADVYANDLLSRM
jgi:hypothetical protein